MSEIKMSETEQSPKLVWDIWRFGNRCFGHFSFMQFGFGVYFFGQFEFGHFSLASEFYCSNKKGLKMDLFHLFCFLSTKVRILSLTLTSAIDRFPGTNAVH
jgi:hypothetical protein